MAQNPLLCSRRQSVCEYKFRGWCYNLFKVLAGLNFSSATVNFYVFFSQKLALEKSSGVRLTWTSAMLVILNLTRGLLSLTSMQLPFFFFGNHSKISSRPYFHWVTGELTHAGCCENMFKFFIKLIFSFCVRRPMCAAERLLSWLISIRKWAFDFRLNIRLNRLFEALKPLCLNIC